MLTPVFWLHVPKTGTSFATALIHELNGSLPASAAAPQCDEHCLDPQQLQPSGHSSASAAAARGGSLDDLFERYPPAMVPGAFSGRWARMIRSTATSTVETAVHSRLLPRPTVAAGQPLPEAAAAAGRLREPLSDVDFRYSVARRLSSSSPTAALQLRYVAPGLLPG